VEAGLRSFDRSMPEEINRVLTDRISDILFVSEPSGVENLLREGIDGSKVHLVGNVMIDSLMRYKALADTSTILDDLSIEPDRYALLTLHRPSNVDDCRTLGRILDALAVIQQDTPVVFPAHPRTQKALVASGLDSRVASMPRLRFVEPLGYLDFLKLMSNAACVLTDSGGVQEETTVLKVPCLTLRENTERPITVEAGSNRLVGTDPSRILTAWKDIAAGRLPDSQTPDLWDGEAAERIVTILAERLR
ncbi:MAG: non-hydrolyzing UDP-N-acetylglucosamine 2-epimerase, partial [Chloroflexota bacterium]